MGEIWHLRVYSATVTLEKIILGRKVGIVKTALHQICQFINRLGYVVKRGVEEPQNEKKSSEKFENR